MIANNLFALSPLDDLHVKDPAFGIIENDTVILRPDDVREMKQKVKIDRRAFELQRKMNEAATGAHVEQIVRELFAGARVPEYANASRLCEIGLQLEQRGLLLQVHQIIIGRARR